MKKTKEMKGITLVALVITIIILIILATISIQSLTNTGLLKKAQEAKNITEEKGIEENKILTNYLEQMNKVDSDSKRLSFIEDKINIGIGNKKNIELNTNVKNGEIQWSSNNEKIAKVEDGTVEAISAGTAIIKAEIPELNLKAECTVITREVPVEKFEYTGNFQIFKAKENGEYKIECWGAGNKQEEYGHGGYTSGVIKLKKDEEIYIYVGEASRNSTPWNKSGRAYNGGGNSGTDVDAASGRSGAGATDIRLVSGNWDNSNSLLSRIMVAGGAGGINYSNRTTNIEFQSGGGLIGYSTENKTGMNTQAYGGSQTSGGIGANGAGNGIFGIGADCSKNSSIGTCYAGAGGGRRLLWWRSWN